MIVICITLLSQPLIVKDGSYSPSRRNTAINVQGIHGEAELRAFPRTPVAFPTCAKASGLCDATASSALDQGFRSRTFLERGGVRPIPKESLAPLSRSLLALSRSSTLSIQASAFSGPTEALQSNRIASSCPSVRSSSSRRE